MGTRTKVLVTFLLIGAVAGVYALQVQNKALFKGQIFDQTEQGEAGDNDNGLLPDLEAELEILAPETEDDDIQIDVNIKNSGEGPITSGDVFKYTIYIDGQEVFSNTDSYTSMEPGDAFSFTYPIPRTIYRYGNSGNIKLTLDEDNTLQESNENNNETTKEFNF